MATRERRGRRNRTRGGGRTLALSEFLAEDSGSNPGTSYVNVSNPANWADQMEAADQISDDTPAYGSGKMVALPNAPRSARGPNIDLSKVPTDPPFTAFLGNVPYDADEEEIRRFLHGIVVTNVRHPQGRTKGFCYADFPDRANLIDALSLNEGTMRNRSVRVDLADQHGNQDGGERDRERGGFRRAGGDTGADPERTMGNWRSGNRQNTQDSGDRGGSGSGGGFGAGSRYGDRDQGVDQRSRYGGDRDGAARTGDWRGGDRNNGRGSDRYSDRGSNRYNDRGGDRYNDRGSDRYNDRGGDRYNVRGGDRYNDRPSDRYNDRGSDRYNDRGGDRYNDRGGDRYNDRESDRYDSKPSDRYNSREGGRDGEDRCDTPRDAPVERPRLQLQPRSKPLDDATSTPKDKKASSIFGAAKPVDTSAREREIEDRHKQQQNDPEREEQGWNRDRNSRVRRTPSKSPVSPRGVRGRTDSDPNSTVGHSSGRREHESNVNSPTAASAWSLSPPDPGSSGTRNNYYALSDETEEFDKGSSPSQQTRESVTSRRDGSSSKIVPAPPPKENIWEKRKRETAQTSPPQGAQCQQRSAESERLRPTEQQTAKSGPQGSPNDKSPRQDKESSRDCREPDKSVQKGTPSPNPTVNGWSNGKPNLVPADPPKTNVWDKRKEEQEAKVPPPS